MTGKAYSRGKAARHLFELLHGDVRMAVIVAGGLEEDGGPQHGFHQVLVQECEVIVSGRVEPQYGWLCQRPLT